MESKKEPYKSNNKNIKIYARNINENENTNERNNNFIDNYDYDYDYDNNQNNLNKNNESLILDENLCNKNSSRKMDENEKEKNEEENNNEINQQNNINYFNYYNSNGNDINVSDILNNQQSERSSEKKEDINIFLNKNYEKEEENNKYLKNIKQKYIEYKNELKNKYKKKKEPLFNKENKDYINKKNEIITFYKKKIREKLNINIYENELEKKMEKEVKKYKNNLIIDYHNKEIETDDKENIKILNFQKMKKESEIRILKEKIIYKKENESKKKYSIISEHISNLNKTFQIKKKKLDNEHIKNIQILESNINKDLEIFKLQLQNEINNDNYNYNENNNDYSANEHDDYLKELNDSFEKDKKIIQLKLELKIKKELEEFNFDKKREIDQQIKKINGSKKILDLQYEQNIKIIKISDEIKNEYIEKFFKYENEKISKMPKVFYDKNNKNINEEIQNIKKILYNYKKYEKYNINQIEDYLINKIMNKHSNLNKLTVSLPEKTIIINKLKIQYYSKIIHLIIKYLSETHRKEDIEYKINLNDINNKDDFLINKIIENVKYINNEFENKYENNDKSNKELSIYSLLKDQINMIFNNYNEFEDFGYNTMYNKNINNIFKDDTILNKMEINKLKNVSVMDNFNQFNIGNTTRNIQRPKSEQKNKLFNNNKQNDNLRYNNFNNINILNENEFDKNNQNINDSSIINQNKLIPELPNIIKDKLPTNLLNNYKKIILFLQDESNDIEIELNQYNKERNSRKNLNEFINSNYTQYYNELNRIDAEVKKKIYENKDNLKQKIKKFNMIKQKCQKFFDNVCLNDSHNLNHTIKEYFDILLNDIDSYTKNNNIKNKKNDLNFMNNRRSFNNLNIFNNYNNFDFFSNRYNYYANRRSYYFK